MALHPVEPPQLPRLRPMPVEEMVASDGIAEYLVVSEGLKKLRGVDFETHGHPAVVLDRATSSRTRVWGWWADGDERVPCVLWASERGWSVTVVEAGALDSEGYERAFWSHRIHLLDLALANALGPFRTLEQLELHVATPGSFGPGAQADRLRSAALWGVVQLRAACARRHHARGDEPPAVVPGAQCSVDQELARFGLVPSLAKSAVSAENVQDAGLEALLRAVRRTERLDHDRGRAVRPGRSKVTS